MNHEGRSEQMQGKSDVEGEDRSVEHGANGCASLKQATEKFSHAVRRILCWKAL